MTTDLIYKRENVVKFYRDFRFEDENGLSGHEYLYFLRLTLEYNKSFNSVRLVDCMILDVYDETGLVNHEEFNSKRRDIEKWFVEVYQHTDVGIRDLESILG